MQNYSAAIDYLYGLQASGIKLGLSNTSSLLASLGNCHRNFHSVHIAGTNGKGSTGAFLGSILKSLGYKTGVYTSPHLTYFEERITVDGSRISKCDATRLISMVMSVAHPEVTFFEFATAMAFIYFAEKQVDIAVIETGLGGRFDATNIITPLVSVITTVSMDHQEYLGDDLASIAMEKCGIIKKMVPVVTGRSESAALDMIGRTCRERESVLFTLESDFSASAPVNDNSCFFFSKKREFGPFEVPLAGHHQRDNTAVALKTLEVLEDSPAGIVWNDSRVKEGIAATRWPGRLETVRESPRVLLDGAHNESAGIMLARYLEVTAPQGVIFLIGIMADKQVFSFLKTIAHLAKAFIIAKPRYHRAMESNELYKLVREKFPEIRLVIEGGSVKNAIDKSLEVAAFGDTVCITGSLFTVGEAKEYFRAKK